MSKVAPRDIVHELQRKWTEYFNRRDVENLVGLYADEACLFGGKPDLSFAPSGIRAYFSALPPVSLRAEFSNNTVVELAPTIISSAGFVSFSKAEPGPSEKPSPFRITLTLVDENGAWKIACHHASPVP